MLPYGGKRGQEDSKKGEAKDKELREDEVQAQRSVPPSLLPSRQLLQTPYPLTRQHEC